MNDSKFRKVLNTFEDLEKVPLLVLLGNCLDKHEERLTPLVFGDKRYLTLLSVGGNHISHILMTFDEFQNEHLDKDEGSIDCWENSLDCISGDGGLVLLPVITVKIIETLLLCEV